MKKNIEFDCEKFSSDFALFVHASKMSLREISKQIGCSAATLSRIQNGKIPDINTFLKICVWAKIDNMKISFYVKTVD